MIKKYFLNNKKRNFSIATVWIKGGSDMDIIGKKGINRILGSLLTRGCKGYDNFSLAEYIESYGAELNQEIFEDGISISIKSLNEHFVKLIPLLDLMINKPNLSDIEFQKVKKYSMDLIKKDKENPFNICFEKWRKIVYSNHPYAFSTLGNESDVSKITHENILSEFEKFKKREKYIISNNLDVKGENLETIGQNFLKQNSNYRNNDEDPKSRFNYIPNDSDQTIIMIGNQTCSRVSNEYLPIKVLESYLSFGMSAALFKLFREKNGITYDLGVFYPLRSENAPFLVYFSVSNKNALFAFELLSTLWNNLLFKPLSDNELHLAKEKLKASFLISSQSLEEILQRKIQLISYGIAPSSEVDFNSKINAISPNNIFSLTKKYFSKPFLSVLGSENTCAKIINHWNKNF